MWLTGGAILVLIVWDPRPLWLGALPAHHWFDFVIFGLAQGSIYALIAMGYTMVYGILRMINFAHSEVFMGGPYTAYFVAAAFASSGFLDRHPILSLVVIFLVSMATSTLIAVLLERVAYRPLRNAPRLVPLITAIGASFFLQYTFRGLYGSGFPGLPGGEDPGGAVALGRIPDPEISGRGDRGRGAADGGSLSLCPADPGGQGHPRRIRGPGGLLPDGDRD